MKTIKADIDKLRWKSDKRIREYLKTSVLNGGYVVKVCKHCGTVYTDPEASTDDCMIVAICKYCFDDYFKK